MRPQRAVINTVEVRNEGDGRIAIDAALIHVRIHIDDAHSLMVALALVLLGHNP